MHTYSSILNCARKWSVKLFWLTVLGGALGVALCSCTPRNASMQRLFLDQPAVALNQEAEVQVSLHPDQVEDYDRICKRLNEMARDDGLGELLHAYVNQALLLRPGQAPDDFAANTADFRQSGICDPWLDDVTGMISQTVLYRSTLMPVRSLGGVIDSLQDNQTMGGMLSRAYVTLWGPPFGEEPIPVLIVQESSGLEHGLVQVVGSGLITQHAHNVGQMQILESTREILPGDLFFQLQVQAQVLPMAGNLLPLGPGKRD